eukprot:1037137-Prorocentrum_minimum.AAC.2
MGDTESQTELVLFFPRAAKKQRRFEIKKWNAVALWAWGKPARGRVSCASAPHIDVLERSDRQNTTKLPQRNN